MKPGISPNSIKMKYYKCFNKWYFKYKGIQFGNNMQVIKPVFSLDDIIQHEKKLYPSEERIPKKRLNAIFDNYYNQVKM